MGPHPDDLHDLDFFMDLVDEAMLNIDSARISAREISYEFFKRRGTLERVFGKSIEQDLGFFPETCSRHFASVTLGLSGINDFPLTSRLCHCIFPSAF